MHLSHIAVGDFVVVSSSSPSEERRRGILRFVGATSFAEGLWCGVELVGSTGRNNGTVGGQKYFECLPNQGIFVRQDLLSRIYEISEPEKVREDIASLRQSISSLEAELAQVRATAQENVTVLNHTIEAREATLKRETSLREDLQRQLEQYAQQFALDAKLNQSVEGVVGRSSFEVDQSEYGAPGKDFVSSPKLAAEGSISELHSELLLTRGKNAELAEALKEAQRTLSEQDEIRSTLELEKELWTEQKLYLEEQVEELRLKHITLESQEATDIIVALRHEAASHVEELAQTKSVMEELHARLEAQDAGVEDKRLEELVERNLYLSEEKDAIEALLQELRQKWSACQRALNTAEALHTELHAEYNELQAAYDDLLAKHEKLSGVMEHNEGALRRRVASLEDELSQCREAEAEGNVQRTLRQARRRVTAVALHHAESALGCTAKFLVQLQQNASALCGLAFETMKKQVPSHHLEAMEVVVELRLLLDAVVQLPSAIQQEHRFCPAAEHVGGNADELASELAKLHATLPQAKSDVLCLLLVLADDMHGRGWSLLGAPGEQSFAKVMDVVMRHPSLAQRLRQILITLLNLFSSVVLNPVANSEWKEAVSTLVTEWGGVANLLPATTAFHSPLLVAAVKEYLRAIQGVVESLGALLGEEPAAVALRGLSTALDTARQCLVEGKAVRSLHDIILGAALLHSADGVVLARWIARCEERSLGFDIDNSAASIEELMEQWWSSLSPILEEALPVTLSLFQCGDETFLAKGQTSPLSTLFREVHASHSKTVVSVDEACRLFLSEQAIRRSLWSDDGASDENFSSAVELLAPLLPAGLNLTSSRGTDSVPLQNRVNELEKTNVALERKLASAEEQLREARHRQWVDLTDRDYAQILRSELEESRRSKEDLKAEMERRLRAQETESMEAVMKLTKEKEDLIEAVAKAQVSTVSPLSITERVAQASTIRHLAEIAGHALHRTMQPLWLDPPLTARPKSAASIRQPLRRILSFASTEDACRSRQALALGH